ncbi:hypothetical protein GCM10020370_63260 [Paenibacillus hodogayensis]
MVKSTTIPEEVLKSITTDEGRELIKPPDPLLGDGAIYCEFFIHRIFVFLLKSIINAIITEA